jgi:plasmid stabilization system protein ParE
VRTIVWSGEALDDFEAAIHFVARDSAQAAHLIADRIERAINPLAEIPTGRPGRVGGNYERVVQKTSYIVSYTLSDTSVRITRIIHAARDWREGEWPAE